MLQEAILTAADRHGAMAPDWMAGALLDAYGPQGAEALADKLPGLIRKEQDARVRRTVLRRDVPRPPVQDASVEMGGTARTPWVEMCVGGAMIAALLTLAAWAAGA
jgi:hypothetical protein